MCGIAYDSESTLALSLLRSVQHRGPDAVRGHDMPGMGLLLHARLSLVGADLDSAAQPVMTARSVTAFNGELFGFRLDAQESESEAQYLARLMDREMDLTGLNAYYAAVSVRPSESLVIVCRDVHGVMPLFYSLHSGRLLVCSEYVALVNVGARRVKQVLPGETLTFRKTRGMLRLVSSRRVTLNANVGSELAPEVTRHLVTQAADACFSHADASPALALSDGLDSRILLHALRAQGYKPHCYTIQPVDSEMSPDLVRYMSDYSGDWTVLRPSDALLHEAYAAYKVNLAPLLGACNPIGVRAFVRHYLVAKYTREKIILCGEGADELFCGYPSHKLFSHDSTLLAKKRLSVLKSLSLLVLYRANVAGMLHGKEYRVPYLDRSLTSYVLSSRPHYGKVDLRRSFPELEAPSKYTSSDASLDVQLLQLMAED